MQIIIQLPLHMKLKTVFPNDYHVKIVLGLPNDCIKAHLQDIGILGRLTDNMMNIDVSPAMPV